MKTLCTLILFAMAGMILTGCSPKTPEEIEAAKYPQVKQNTPEEEKAMRERLGLNEPVGAHR
ncbi:MAG: hypothetical protein BGO01_01805 [Armatimonadetes bacterium 55-13]|nr:hypothetical protein [Armatimonadota bacterium]OJU65673.1 MAG: hypothetical protein BGO01_01805 [Armatimonadetes bacterium 55-13]